jgi:hypothetical protein
MNVFDLDRVLVNDYERFARSFTQIRAIDIRSQVEALYASDRFWPEPLVIIASILVLSTVLRLINWLTLDLSILRQRTSSASTASPYPYTAIKHNRLRRHPPDRALSSQLAQGRASHCASLSLSSMQRSVPALRASQRARVQS